MLLGFRATEGVLAVFGDLGERTAAVYGTAAGIVNPDKRLRDHDLDAGLLSTTYTMRWEPRRAVSGGGTSSYDVTENLFGAVHAPALGYPERSDLIDAVRSVSGHRDDAADAELKQDAREVFDRLPPALDAVAVVEFARPMTAERLTDLYRKYGLCGGEGVSYIYSLYHHDDSGGDPPENAVVWDRYPGYRDMRRPAPERAETPQDVARRCGTGPEAALASFRDWVGVLDEDDDLAEFGLDHGALRLAADEGVAYGLVADRWKAADLGRLLGDPDVRTVRVTDVAFDLGR
ncbi:hypothetical protein [Planomonospora venezuelensis]|uniref:Uncharacterized protein n=1 Tax=Planomonospora venezuelensis TaxID=1999 RepID=A0A841CVK1_PLAVE|nr:hypothetical protein [Planomonospora venezuelensis]MBB5961339.1 hypothetical protein [Planomonospora venezuelensis]